MAMTSDQTGGVAHTCAVHTWRSSKVTPDRNLVTVYSLNTGVAWSEWRHEAHDGFSRRSKYRRATSISLRYCGACYLVIFHGSLYLVASEYVVLRQAMLGWFLLSFYRRATWIWRQTVFVFLSRCYIGEVWRHCIIATKLKSVTWIRVFTGVSTNTLCF